MKKFLTGFMAVALVATVGSTTAFAACGRGGGHHNNGCYNNYHYNHDCYYVDEDGDGICDNYSSDRCPGYGYRQNYVNPQAKSSVTKQAKTAKVTKVSKSAKKTKAAKVSKKSTKKAKAVKVSKKAKKTI